MLSIVVLVGLSCLCGSLPASESTPFSRAPQGGILVPVVLNGAGPFPMLLDTGASHSSVSEELAQTLQLPVIARTMVQSPVGGRERIVVRAERLKMGTHEMSVTPTVVPQRDLAIAGGVHGVVGQDVLSELRYTIDYRRHHIQWGGQNRPAASRPIAVLPLAFHEGLPLVELSQGDSTLRMVADSGSGGLVLFNGGTGRLPMTPDGGLVRLGTFQGTGLARSVRINRLQVGRSTWRDLPAVVLERTSSPAHQGDGLLPLHLFDRVTFDGHAGRLIVG